MKMDKKVDIEEVKKAFADSIPMPAEYVGPVTPPSWDMTLL